MPVLTGPEMAYRVLVHDLGFEETPIILLSGVLDFPRVAAAVDTPYFLGKPFSLEQLLPMIDRALSERIPHRPHLTPREPPRSDTHV
jgi:FixJ family two-component response regulator